MVSITHKSSTLRKAIATAVVKASNPDTIEAVRNRTVPKGDVLEFARAAGLLAIKKTSDLIPDCHPLPIEFASIQYELGELELLIRVEVHTIYKTGVEVEAMHGASLVALTIYDMLKPIDKGVEIHRIRLEEKKGGKSELVYKQSASVRTAIIVCSDSVDAGECEDKTGPALQEKLRSHGLEAYRLTVIKDDLRSIQEMVQTLREEDCRLALFSGGTGLSPRDLTPEAIRPLIDREIPGIMETARQYGQARMPYSMLSRGVAGFIGEMLTLTLPGSPRAVAEYVDALFPAILHVFKVSEGSRHE